MNTPLPMRGTPSLFSEEVEVNIANAVVAMQLLKAHVTHNSVIAMANSMQKGTTTSKIFNNESVSARWYQAWISQMIAKEIIKISSGTVPHDATREVWCT